MRVVWKRGSSMTSWRSEPESHAMCSVSPAFVRQPSDARGVASGRLRPASLGRSDGCAACTRDPWGSDRCRPPMACLVHRAVGRRRVEFVKDKLEPFPKFIWTPPNRGQCLASMMLSSGHPSSPFWSSMTRRSIG